MFELTHKKALVTGATGGIGGAITAALVKSGANVMATGSNEDKLSAVKATHGESVITKACNLSDIASVEALVGEAEATLGGLDILICNAGVTRDTLAMRMKDEQWEEVINLNLTVNFRLMRSALKGMMKQRSGRIIAITSVVGWMGNAGQTNYCASKAGLTGMVKALARETATRGITVNCIAPGFIATSMTDALTPEQKDNISRTIPMQRMGTPEEIAGAAVFLASGSAAYITGETLHVNGGMIMV